MTDVAMVRPVKAPALATRPLARALGAAVRLGAFYAGGARWASRSWSAASAPAC